MEGVFTITRLTNLGSYLVLEDTMKDFQVPIANHHKVEGATTNTLPKTNTYANLVNPYP
jgi:hypothetical protein